MSDDRGQLTRRHAVRTIAGAGLAAGLGPLLAACGGETRDTPTTPVQPNDPRPRALKGSTTTTPTATEPTARAAATPRSVIISERAWSFGGDVGRLIETPNFNLYTTLSRSRLLDRLPLFLELSLARYAHDLADLPEPRYRLETYVMGTRGQWARLTRRLMGGAAELYLKIPRGGFAAESRGVYFDIGANATLAVAAHEGWHQYTQSRFATHLPVWLEEGVAAYCEGFRWEPTDGGRPVFLPWKNRERHRQLRTALGTGELMPLPELLESSPQALLVDESRSTLTYYAQVWALVHFLREGEGGAHAGAFRSILTAGASGSLYSRVGDRFGQRVGQLAARRRTGAAVLGAFTRADTLAELDVAYRRFCVQIVQPGTERRIDTGRSPLA